MHLNRILTATAVLALPVFAIGCVPQDRYDHLLTAHRALEEQLTIAEGERDAERANLEAMRSQMGRTGTSIGQLEQENARLHADLDRVSRDYDAMLRRVSSLEIGPLPVEVESAIQQLAAAHSSVLSFDAARGVLRFASDFTFDLGSVALTSEAARTLNELARILNTREASGFEARIVGHTDDVRIARAETLRNHPTNVHLSVHRAISVRDALASAGISPERMQVAGYGAHRPLVPNRQGGTAENRRVEIFLVPMPQGVGPSSYEEPTRAGTPATRQHTTVPTDDPMK